MKIELNTDTLSAGQAAIIIQLLLDKFKSEMRVTGSERMKLYGCSKISEDKLLFHGM